MTPKQKIMLGMALGIVGFIMLKRLQSTKTVIVDTFDTPLPNVIDVTNLAGR